MVGVAFLVCCLSVEPGAERGNIWGFLSSPFGLPDWCGMLLNLLWRGPKILGRTHLKSNLVILGDWFGHRHGRLCDFRMPVEVTMQAIGLGERQ